MNDITSFIHSLLVIYIELGTIQDSLQHAQNRTLFLSCTNERAQCSAEQNGNKIIHSKTQETRSKIQNGLNLSGHVRRIGAMMQFYMS